MEPAIIDTIGWILFKRGEYEQALRVLESSEHRMRNQPEVRFHVGMARYMLMDEDPARTALQVFVDRYAMIKPLQHRGRLPNDAAAEKEEAEKCLTMLDFKAEKPTPKAVATLKVRLTEKPDDPVALDRLADLFEATNPKDKLRQDPLALKAIGVRAYHRGEI
jgi:hypothetical protein